MSWPIGLINQTISPSQIPSTQEPEPTGTYWNLLEPAAISAGQMARFLVFATSFCTKRGLLLRTLERCASSSLLLGPFSAPGTDRSPMKKRERSTVQRAYVTVFRVDQAEVTAAVITTCLEKHQVASIGVLSAKLGANEHFRTAAEIQVQKIEDHGNRSRIDESIFYFQGPHRTSLLFFIYIKYTK